MFERGERAPACGTWAGGELLSAYLLQGGWRDGRFGFVTSVMGGWTRFPQLRPTCGTWNAGRGTASESALRVALLTSARSWRGSGVSLGRIRRRTRRARPRSVRLHRRSRESAKACRIGLRVGMTPTRDTGSCEIRGSATGFVVQLNAVIVDKLRDLGLGGWGSLGLRGRLLYPNIACGPRHAAPSHRPGSCSRAPGDLPFPGRGGPITPSPRTPRPTPTPFPRGLQRLRRRPISARCRRRRPVPGPARDRARGVWSSSPCRLWSG